LLLLSVLFIIPASAADPAPEDDISAADYDPVSIALTDIDTLLSTAVGNRTVTGAVVLVGHGDDIILEKAFGTRSPNGSSPMTVDTVFDIASLTKVVATAPAVMSLVENKSIRLDAPLSKYLPAAGKGSHRRITIRQLLTHYSGITSDLRPPRRSRKRKKVYSQPVLSRIYTAKLIAPVGQAFQYSDIGFAILGKVVENVSRQRFDKYVQKTIIDPLQMSSTCFRPGRNFEGRIAPSEKGRGDHYVCGTVQDPTAGRLNGIAGHAGLFSTARDLSRFARMILNGGTLDGIKILSPGMIAMMTSPQSPAGKEDVRGLGWDIDSRYSSLKGNFFSPESFGHTGYTGTSIWIDPSIGTYVILLTNRPNLTDDHTDILTLRRELSEIVGSIYANPVVEKAN